MSKGVIQIFIFYTYLLHFKHRFLFLFFIFTPIYILNTDFYIIILYFFFYDTKRTTSDEYT